LDDQSSAPSYLVEVKDNLAVDVVKFAIAKECVGESKANKVAALKNGLAEIKLTQKNSLVDLKSLVGEPLCLSIWARDKAGNISSKHQIKFIWTSLAPPLAVLVNDQIYNTRADSFDFQNSLIAAKEFAHFSSKSAKLISGTVIGHVTFKNPHAFPMQVKQGSVPPIELNITTKKRIRTQVDFINILPELLGGYGGKKLILIHGFYSPFVEKPHRNGGYYRSMLEYDGNCQKNEIAIFINEPKWTFKYKNGYWRGVQKLQCLASKYLLPKYFDTEPFGNLAGDFVMSTQLRKFIIGPEFLESKVAAFEEV